MTDQRELAKVLESTAVVRFQDCDPFGHLNNARYLDYFMNARQDQLQEFYDFDILAVGRQQGKNWVVSKSSIAYLAPAMMGEGVRIQTKLIHASQRRLVVEGIMLDAGGQQLKAVAWVEFMFVDLRNSRSASHPDEFMQLFNQVAVGDIYNRGHFDERVARLKSEFRHRRHLSPERASTLYDGAQR